MAAWIPALVWGAAVTTAAQVPAGGEFPVNSFTTGPQYYPHAVMDRRGGFVMVWGSFRGQGPLSDIVGQRFAAAGDRRGTEFVVNAYTLGNQGLRPGDRPLAAFSDGRFMVAWTSQQPIPGDQYNVFARRFAASGAAVDSDTRVHRE
ncbi:MAG TPA: hypothetical protein VFO85_06950, partial [Vicinamibacteria bacterium]|nr:hypothetical protein [Vicinamibacteria bacterium]